MLFYCVALLISLGMFFLVNVGISELKRNIVDKDKDVWNILRVPLYLGLLAVYHVFKTGLKRLARWVDRAILVPNFSFEIITEMLISSLYWSNFRLFCLRFRIYYDDPGDEAISYTLFCAVAIIHLSSELFQNYVRYTAAYFNWKCTHKNSDKKSNVTQWKVRGAIDTSIRFIISIYSFIFSMVLYGTFTISDNYGHAKNWYQMQAALLNCGIFVIEMIMFVPIIFIPGCAGKISDQQQINMAEPLMRMYNADQTLFNFLFCGSLIMASLLIF